MAERNVPALVRDATGLLERITVDLAECEETGECDRVVGWGQDRDGYCRIVIDPCGREYLVAVKHLP